MRKLRQITKSVSACNQHDGDRGRCAGTDRAVVVDDEALWIDGRSRQRLLESLGQLTIAELLDGYQAGRH